MQESNRLELKRQLTENFERSVVSFMNYSGGGELLIGIDDDGRVVGVENPDQLQLQIVDRIHNNIQPATQGLFDIVLEKMCDKIVIRIIISCGQQRPYYIRKYGRSEKGCFLRVGTSSRPMFESMIEELMSKRQPNSLQTIVSPRHDLTFAQLRILYDERSLTLTEQFERTLELRSTFTEYNYVGYLLADENRVPLIIARYAGSDKDDLVESRNFGHRCLAVATKNILNRLDSENRTFTLITSTTRQEKELVASLALREIVVNAIVHNDYSLGFPQFDIFHDRIVITSCGGLVSGLSEDDFFKCRSMPRNRELMRIFHDLGLVEQLGSGMSRILKVYDPSIFELSKGFTVVTLPLSDPTSLLQILKSNPNATISILTTLTGKSYRTVQRELKKYQDSGQLIREGSRKNGRWIVID